MSRGDTRGQPGCPTHQQQCQSASPPVHGVSSQPMTPSEMGAGAISGATVETPNPEVLLESLLVISIFQKVNIIAEALALKTEFKSRIWHNPWHNAGHIMDLILSSSQLGEVLTQI